MTVLLTSEHDRAVLRSFARRIDEQDAGAHNNLGVLYYNKGMTEEAVSAFTRALELDPRMTIAQRNLEIAYFNSGYYDSRLAELRQRLTTADDDRGARLELARTCLLLGDARRAVSELRRLHGEDGRDTAILHQLAIAEARGGDLEAAARWLGKGLAAEPDNAALLLQYGEVAYHRGLNDEARQALMRCIELRPDDADAHFLLGFVAGDLGDHETAAAMTRRAQQLNPALGRAHANLSLERYDSRSYERALELKAARGVEAPMEVAPGKQLAHFNLGLAFRQKRYFDEALREYRQALDNGEDPSLVRQAIAEVHLLRRDPRSALEMLSLLVAEQPRSPGLWNERGVALHQMGRTEEAMASYQAAIDIDDAYVLAHNNLGIAACQANRTGLALEAFRTALTHQPGFTRARLNLALLLVRTDQHSLALAAYRQVLRLFPDNAVAWNGVGLVLSHLRRFEDARNAFARAIECRESFAEAHYNLSFALSSLGDYQGALRATRRALELDPFYSPQRFELALDLEYEDPRFEIAPETNGDLRSDVVDDFTFDPSALELLFHDLDAGAVPAAPHGDLLAGARIELAQGNWEQAINAARAALSRLDDPRDRALSLSLMGEAYLGATAWGEALDRFSQARHLDPDLRAALTGELRSLVESRRFHEAAGPAAELLQHADIDATELVLVAKVQLEAGQPATARGTLEKARALSPGSAEVLTALGHVAAADGNRSEAISCYQSAAALDHNAWPARLALAWTLIDIGETDRAEAELRSIIGANPASEDAVLTLARLQRQLGRPADTIEPLATFLLANPWHLDGLASLGESLITSGRREDAAFAFGRIRKFDPDHVAALYFEGAMRAERHDFAGARELWARIVHLEPAGEYARRARRESRIANDLERIFAGRTTGGGQR